MPEIAQSMEHATFPLLQIAPSLAARPVAYTFAVPMAEEKEELFMEGMCQTLLKAVYTLLIDALFPRIPALSMYMTFFLCDAGGTDKVKPLWIVDGRPHQNDLRYASSHT
jgi:hypothetical protein